MESSNTISGKLLIPTESGGLIIGRGGVTIRAIQEESGARIQVTSKDNPESRISRERILTLTGSIIIRTISRFRRLLRCLYQRIATCSP